MGFDLKDLKEDYAEIEKEYKLPSFQEINELFEIERISSESDCLIRVVRKIIFEKVLQVFSFVEMLSNPGNAPKAYSMFFASATKEDFEIIHKLHKILFEFFLESLELDSKYNPKSEAKFINEICTSWTDLSNDFQKLILKIRNPAEIIKKEKSYYG